MDGWDGLLAEGETIRWQGRPDNRIVWTDLARFETVMGLIFTGFSLFWMKIASSMAVGTGAPGVFRFFPFFGLIFLAVGLYMLVLRLFWDAYLRRGTHYTLTDRQAFIATQTLGRRRLETWPIGAETELKLDDGPGGAVWFAKKVVHHKGRHERSADGRMRYSPPSTSITPVGFRRLADPRAPYALMRDMVAAARRKESAN